MIQKLIVATVLVVTVVACSKDDKAKPAPQVSTALQQCMDKHRWDTTAVNTSRMAVQLHFHRKGQGELARYVSDYDAVKIVYCSGL